MNQSDVIVFMFKQALMRSLQSGGVTMIEELAEQLPQEHLGKFIDILKRIHEKKKRVVSTP